MVQNTSFARYFKEEDFEEGEKQNTIEIARRLL